MPTETNDTILKVIIITLVFLLGAFFLLVYVLLYNKRKRKHAEEKAVLQREFEDELIRTQLEVQEQTLRTIGMEIHDNVGQLLSLTRLTLSTVNVAGDAQKAEEKINNSLNLLNNSIKELRQMASLLHSENLLTEGLEKAIRKELDMIRQTDRYLLEVMKLGNPTQALDSKRELIAFRIVQEILNNIIKHANASVIKVTFQYALSSTVIRIEDNGNGFNLEEVLQQRSGLGINNLYKRAKIIGGELSIQSTIDKGTTVTLLLTH